MIKVTVWLLLEADSAVSHPNLSSSCSRKQEPGYGPMALLGQATSASSGLLAPDPKHLQLCCVASSHGVGYTCTIQALRDFKERIRHYEEVYEPLEDRTRHYIKV